MGVEELVSAAVAAAAAAVGIAAVVADVACQPLCPQTVWREAGKSVPASLSVLPLGPPFPLVPNRYFASSPHQSAGSAWKQVGAGFQRQPHLHYGSCLCSQAAGYCLAGGCHRAGGFLVGGSHPGGFLAVSLGCHQGSPGGLLAGGFLVGGSHPGGFLAGGGLGCHQGLSVEEIGTWPGPSPEKLFVPRISH